MKTGLTQLTWFAGVLVGSVLLLSSCASDPEPIKTDQLVDDRIVQAEALISRGRSEDALDVLSSLRGVDVAAPQKAKMSTLMGEALVGLNRSRQALDAFARADSANLDRNDFLSFRIGMGSARAAALVEQWGSVEFWIEKAIRFAPSVAERDQALLLAAEAAFRRGQESAARRYLNEVRDLNSFGYSSLNTKLGPSAAENALSTRVVTRPRINRRDEWGAAEPNRRNPALPMTRPYRVTLHHTADRGETPRGREAVIRRIKAYQRAHLLDEGWADIGYHFLVDAEGNIWEGRGVEWQGAHAGNPAANAGNIGVCLLGNFDREEPSAEQKAALKVLLIWLTQSYEISKTQLYGHDEVLEQYGDRATRCPGAHLTRYLQILRREL